MEISKHGITLCIVQDLLRKLGTTLLEDDPFQRALQDTGNFDVPRNVCAIEKDGIPMVVRFGTTVSPLEAEVTVLVATHTSVRVPEIYGVFSDTVNCQTVTYIVEERLLGTNLRTALPKLEDAARETITAELRSVFSELSTLSSLRDQLGPIRGPWANSYFRSFIRRMPCNEDTARDTESFIRYFIAYSRTSELTVDRASDRILDAFDLSQPPKFSHGDLQLSNIMVHDGHVSGIIDWAEAGWYPYFWDAFVLFKSVHMEHRLARLWLPMVQQLCDLELPEASEMWSLLELADDAW